METAYETNDKVMVMVLLMAGFRPLEIKESRDNQLIYLFDDKTVKETVDKIRLGNGGEMTFMYKDYWAAEMTWQMNLRHNSRRRK